MAIQKQEYFISQSISGSFLEGDIANVSFLARRFGNPVDGLSYIQFADIYGFLDSGSFNTGSGFEASDNGKTQLLHSQFSLPVKKSDTGGYGEKSFTAKLNTNYEVITLLVSGSVRRDTSITQTGATKTDLNIDYDQFKITIEQPKVELVPEGFLAYTGPKRYVKIGTDGEVTIKGGEIEAQKIVAGELEVYGDISLFGEVSASGGTTPYNQAPENILSGEGADVADDGGVVEYARGDHKHVLPFTTLDQVSNNGLFTSLSGSTATFGVSTFNNTVAKILAPGGAADTTALEITGTLDVTGDLIARNFITINSTTIDTTLSDGSTNFGNSDDDIHSLTGSFHQSGSDNNYFRNKVWIGTVTGSSSSTQMLTVYGDISASGNLYIDDDIRMKNGNFIGFSTAFNLQFNNDGDADDGLVMYNGGTPLHRFEEGGDVGIGTGANNPLSKLHVYGKMRSDAGTYAVELDGENVSGPRINLGEDSDTDKYMVVGAFGSVNNINSTNRDLHIYGSTFATGAFFEVATNRWGFGTNTPDSVISLKGSHTNFLEFERTDDSDTGKINFDLTGNGGTDELTISSTNHSGSFRFKNGNQNPILYMSGSTGYVGIGTTSPSVILDVEQTDSSTSALIDIHQSDSGTGTDAGVRFQKNGSLKGTVGYNAGTDVVSLGYGAFDNTHLSIDSSGKVGIGTTNPSFNFDVTGDIRVTGDISSSNIITKDQVIAGKVTPYDTAGNLVSYGNGKNSLIIQRITNTSDTGLAFRNSGGAYSQVIYSADDGTGGNDSDLRFAGGDSTSTIDNLNDYLTIKGGTTATAGFVGIGTTSPSKKLTVTGDVSASDDVYAKHLVINDTAVISGSTNTKITNTGGGYIDLKSNSSTYGVIIRDYNSDNWGNISTNDGYLELGYNNASGPLYITDNDFIGIGVNNPAATLEVAGDIYVEKSIQFGKNASDWGDAEISSSGETLTLSDNTNIDAWIDKNDTDGPGYFSVRAHTNKDTIMRVSSSGQVGIGTASPTAKLEVRGGAEALAMFSSSGDYQIEFDRAGEEKYDLSHGNSGLFFRKSNVIIAGYTQDHDFKVFDSSGNPYANFDGSTAKVGIGKVSPTKKLEVEGDISASGDLYLENQQYVKFRNTSGTDVEALRLNASSELIIGDVNSNSEQIFFYANSGTPRMTIDSSGYVGIGTTTPGDSHADYNDFVIGNGSGHWGMNIKAGVGSKSNIAFSDSDGGHRGMVYYDHSDDKLYLVGGGNGYSSNPDWFGITLTNDDKVGIGTDSPEVLLHLMETGSSNCQLRIESTGSGGSENDAAIRLFAHNDYTQEAYFRIGDTGLKIGTTDNEDITFETKNGDVSLVLAHGSSQPHNVYFHGYNSNDNTMMVSQSGHVGIGKKNWHTNNPPSTLTVEGDISASGDLFVRSGSFSKDIVLDNYLDTAIKWKDGSGGITNNYIDYRIWKTYATGGKEILNTAGIIKLESKNQSNGLVVSGSNVGIGTATPSPSHELQVYNATDHASISVQTGDGSKVAYIGLRNSDRNWHLRTDGGIGDKFIIRDNTEGENRLTIDSSGYVGIGTTNPAMSLDVESGNEYLARFKSTDNKGYISIQDDDTTGYISAENGKLSLGGNTGVNVSNLNIETASGHVGIGTSSPSSLLEVQSTNSQAYYYPLALRNPYNSETSLDYGVGMKLMLDDAVDTKWGAITYEANTQYGNSGDLKFYVDGATNTSALMIISGSGNVGIGTTTPQYNLDVYESSGNGMIRAYGSSIGRLSLQNSSRHFSTSVQGTNWLFYDETGGATRMTIDMNGNVGIGINSGTQTAKLHVVGDIFASGSSGNITANGTISVDSDTGDDAKISFKESGTKKWDMLNDGDDSDKLHIKDSSDTSLLKVAQAGDVWIKNNLDVDGEIKAKTFTIENTVVNQTILAQSGSTSFGDTSDDTHTFTGSLQVSGSMILQDSSSGSSTKTLLNVGGDGNGRMLVRHIDGKDHDSDSTHPLYLQYSNSNDVNIAQGGGNVLIGGNTGTSADDKLHVSGSSTAYIQVRNSSNTGKAGIRLNAKRDDGSTTSNYIYKSGSVQYFDLDSGIHFAHNGRRTVSFDNYGFGIVSSSTSNVNGVGEEFYKVDIINKRLGIGTNSPDYTLDVAGNVGINEYIYHNGDVNTYFRFNGTDKITLSANDNHVNVNTYGMGIGTTIADSDNSVNLLVANNISGSNLYLGGTHIYSNAADYILRFMSYGSSGVKLQTSGLIVSGNYTDGKNAFDSMAGAGQESAYFGGDVAIGIHDNGKLGVGIANPSTLIHLSQSAGSGFNTDVRLSGPHGSVGDGSAIFFKTSPNETADRYGVKLGAIRSDADNGASVFKIELEKDMVADTASPDGLSEVFRINEKGNVGIGTTTPGFPLDITSDVSIGLEVESSYSGPSGIRVKRTGGDTVTLLANYSGFGGGLKSSDALRFSVGGYNTTDPAMYIETDRKVGIGNTNPKDLLHVGDSATATFATDPDKAMMVASTGSEEEVAYQLYVAEGGNNIRSKYYVDDATKYTGWDTSWTTGFVGYQWKNAGTTIMTLLKDGNLGIGTDSPDYKLQVDGNIVPESDDSHDLGTADLRWQDLYAVKTTTGGIYEAGLETKGLKDLPIGTLVVWKDGKCVPCNKYADELVMGVAGEKDEPIILGAEPILVTGDVKIGEYIITSNVEGHGESIDSEYLLQRNLYGKVIGQALESAEGDSSLIKCMIRKM